MLKPEPSRLLSAVALAPLSYLYGAITQTRAALYQAGLLRSHQIPAPVISIGNITTGGTGKTPLVVRVARTLAEMNFRPAILTRGYGRRTPASQRVLVSDGTRLLADALTGGDEPQLLAAKLLGTAAVISQADRVAAARWALAHLRSTAFVLDDAFQHRRIARDLDLVVVDATDPWSNGHLLPRGLLREPLSALERAQAIILTRADQAAHIAQLRAQIGLYTTAPILTSRMKLIELRPLSADTSGPCPVEVGAFCALGNPAAFFAQLREAGYRLSITRSFPDHHYYTDRELEEVAQEAQAAGATALVTTAKDAVKLRAADLPLPCYVAEIEIDFGMEENAALAALLARAVRGGQADQTSSL